MFGTVSVYSRLKGYGFIVPDDPDAPDYFVHFSFISTNPAQRFLKIGQRVEFDPAGDSEKPQAHNVRKIAAPASQSEVL